MAVQGGDGLRRLVSQQRKLSTSKARKPWRHRAKRTPLRKTPAEKAEAAAKRRDHKVSYNEALSKARGIVMEQATLLREEFGGHTVEWYFEEIMQRARMTKSKRETSRWNAFLRNEVKCMNDGKYCSSLLYYWEHSTEIFTALPAGQHCQKAFELMPQISAKWNAMSNEEQIAATNDTLEDLKNQKEMRSLSLQNVPINAFHDTRANLAAVKSEVRYSCTAALINSLSRQIY